MNRNRFLNSEKSVWPQFYIGQIWKPHRAHLIGLILTIDKKMEEGHWGVKFMNLDGKPTGGGCKVSEIELLRDSHEQV